MCQATVYLDGEEIMRDVLLVEPSPEGIRLIALFEPVQVIPANIQKIDLIKHIVILESKQGQEENHERIGKIARPDTPLDRTQ
jgi:predicted RNA-binding protein